MKRGAIYYLRLIFFDNDIILSSVSYKRISILGIVCSICFLLLVSLTKNTGLNYSGAHEFLGVPFYVYIASLGIILNIQFFSIRFLIYSLFFIPVNAVRLFSYLLLYGLISIVYKFYLLVFTNDQINNTELIRTDSFIFSKIFYCLVVWYFVQFFIYERKRKIPKSLKGK